MIELSCLQFLVRNVGCYVKEQFDERNIEATTKSSSSDFVTKCDIKAQSMIEAAIRKEFPNDHIVGEEGRENKGLSMGRCWVIDPIDGTANFVNGHIFYNISIALLVDKVPMIGVVYAPSFQELFWAVRGKGAFLNGRKIKVATSKPLLQSLVNVGVKQNEIKRPDITDDQRKRILDESTHNFQQILMHASDMRRHGACALELCWIACGRLDASFESGIQVWDMAAGMLILTEAGGHHGGMDGVATNIPGRHYLSASSSALASEIATKIKFDPDLIF